MVRLFFSIISMLVKLAVVVTLLLPVKEVRCSYLIDASYPLIITNFLHNHSQFGMSVALSEGPETKFQPDVLKTITGWIFIGAPTENTTLQNDIFEPGVLWRCDLGYPKDNSKKTSLNACQIINIDPIPPKNDKGQIPKRGNGSPQTEDEGGTWIGGTVEVKNSRMVTCGHRYTRGKRMFMNGICYWYPADANRFSSRSYHQSNLTKNDYYNRLIPFLGSNAQDDQYFQFVDVSRSQSEEAHEWGLGQVGISQHLIKNVSDGNELLLGAPGARLWSGAVVKYIDNPTKESGRNFRANRNVNDPTYSEFVVGYRGGTSTLNNSYRFDYFGYGVSSGKFFDKTELLYVGGAPRGNELSGEVVIFTIPNANKSNSETVYKRIVEPVLVIQPPMEFMTESFGSYFGSVVLSVDADGDGKDELFVGAPMYNQRRIRSKRSSYLFDENSGERGDHGCVFVYWFNSTSRNLDGEPQMLNGSGAPAGSARFGSAISYIKWTGSDGDDNENDKTYIVVGSPYEDNERGAIYIYKVKERFTISFVQKILAKEISDSIYGFGASLSLPQDIDKNLTPDLAVGAYKSNQVVLFRTRLRILLNGTVTFKSIKNNKIKRGANNVDLTVCTSFKREGVGNFDENLNLELWSSIVLDSRLTLPQNSKMLKNYANETNTILYKQTSTEADKDGNEDNCKSINVIFKDSKGLWENESIEMEGIRFVHSFWYNETSDVSFNNFVEYKIKSENGKVDNLNGDSKTKLFERHKPYPVLPKQNNYLLDIAPNDCNRTVCRPKLKVSAEWFQVSNNNISQNPITEFILGTYSQMVLRVEISNEGETAERPTFQIQWSNKFPVVSKEDKSNFLLRKDICQHRSSDNIYDCTCPWNIVKDHPRKLDFLFDFQNLKASSPNTTFEVSISVTVPTITDGGSATEVKLFLIAETKVQLRGIRRKENLRNPFVSNCTEAFSNQSPIARELYPSWRQTFTAYIVGPSGVENIDLTFKIPWAKTIDANKTPIKPLVLVNLNPTITNDRIQCEELPGKGHFYVIDSTSSKYVNFTTVVEAGGTTRHDLDTNDKSLHDDNGNPVAFRRRKRSLQEPETISIDYQTIPVPVKEASFPIEENTIFVHCNENSEFTCVEIKCTANKVKGNSVVQIPFELFIVKEAIDDLLKDGKEVVLIESTGFAKIFSQKESAILSYSDKDISQTRLIQIHAANVAEWVYIVGIICGILQLLLIVFILYKCGFFKREAKTQLKLLKAEVRKSMMPQGGFEQINLNDDSDATFSGKSREELIDSKKDDPDDQQETPTEDISETSTTKTVNFKPNSDE